MNNEHFSPKDHGDSGRLTPTDAMHSGNPPATMFSFLLDCKIAGSCAALHPYPHCLCPGQKEVNEGKAECCLKEELQILFSWFL